MLVLYCTALCCTVLCGTTGGALLKHVVMRVSIKLKPVAVARFYPVRRDRGSSIRLPALPFGCNLMLRRAAIKLTERGAIFTAASGVRLVQPPCRDTSRLSSAVAAMAQ